MRARAPIASQLHLAVINGSYTSRVDTLDGIQGIFHLALHCCAPVRVCLSMLVCLSVYIYKYIYLLAVLQTSFISFTSFALAQPALSQA